mmetsp:Transcript_17310/g.51773  ORF Transcript_17310/g.51773 Transcript_17310/m.51773 type:complete len:250 (-) Transcript_17310:132-881(-)
MDFPQVGGGEGRRPAQLDHPLRRLVGRCALAYRDAQREHEESAFTRGECHDHLPRIRDHIESNAAVTQAAQPHSGGALDEVGAQANRAVEDAQAAIAIEHRLQEAARTRDEIGRASRWRLGPHAKGRLHVGERAVEEGRRHGHVAILKVADRVDCPRHRGPVDVSHACIETQIAAPHLGIHWQHEGVREHDHIRLLDELACVADILRVVLARCVEENRQLRGGRFPHQVGSAVEASGSGRRSTQGDARH